jgi:hypothetical protein
MIHQALRNLFEHQLHIMVDKVKNGEDYSRDFDKILFCYNMASEDCEKLSELIKQLE